MLGLPKNTEVNKTIFKKTIYEKFMQEMTLDRRKQFDADISRMVVTNEISPVSMNINEGKHTKAIFVIRIELKKKDYIERNMILISKLFGQKLLLVLNYEDETNLLIYQTKLIKSEWQQERELTLKGLDLDQIWENIVSQVGKIKVDKGNTLDEQIEINEQKTRLLKYIEKLEKESWNERQPKKKFTLAQEIKKCKDELEDM